jgi:hypothetical protein
MDRTDVENHADVGPGKPAEELDVSRFVHREFEDSRVVFGPQSKESQRDADLGIEIGCCLEDLLAVPQDAGDEFFRCGLADAPGDAYHANIVPLAPVGSETLESRRRIADVEGRTKYVERPGDDCARRPGLECFWDKVVSVVMDAGESEKEFAFVDTTRVDCGSLEDGGLVAAGGDQEIPQRRSNVVQPHFSRHVHAIYCTPFTSAGSVGGTFM